MPDSTTQTYTLTVRPHRGIERRFEYVLSVQGSNPIVSDTAYETFEAAREAGHAHGRGLGLDPAATSA